MKKENYLHYLCFLKYSGKYLLMNSLLSFLLLISVCQVCLYRQNSSVSCTPELCNNRQAWPAEEVSDVISVVLPWRQTQCPGVLWFAAQGHTSVTWQREEWHIFCLGRQHAPWQAPQKAHPDLCLFALALLITSWLLQMPGLVSLAG